MGTHYKVTLVSGTQLSNNALQGLESGVLQQLNDVDNAMSTYKASSELSRWNQLQSGECSALSSGLNAVVGLALQVADQSEGYFNPLVGTLVNRWGFGFKELQSLPSSGEVAGLIPSVDLDKLQYDAGSQILCKVADAKEGVYLDLSAIAKGYAVDKVSEFLKSNGFENYLIDVGGELRVSGVNPQDGLWRLAIEKPDAGFQTVHRVITLSNAAVATSGDYRNFYEHDGRRYSHTINPHTGYPVTHNLASVTVIADSVAQADAWATAMSAAGPDKAREWAQKFSLAVYLLQRENSSEGMIAEEAKHQYSSWHSAQFGRYLDSDS